MTIRIIKSLSIELVRIEDLKIVEENKFMEKPNANHFFK